MKRLLTEKRDKVYIGLLLVAAFLGTYGISYVCSLAAGTHFSNGIFSAAVIVAAFILIKMAWEQFGELTDKRARCKRLVYSYGLSVFFCVLLIMGYQLKMIGWTEPGIKGKGLILLRGSCLALVVWPFANYFFSWVEKLQVLRADVENPKVWKPKYVFLFSWLVIFLLWIPVFLAYYPAVMAYDFHRQSIEAARGFMWFNSYQPLAHTWLIWLFFNIGKALDGYQTGMALYSIFQMLLLSVSCAYSSNVVYRLVKKKSFVVGMVLFFGLFPLISILSVGVTKDVPFSALFLVFISLFVERTFLCNEKKQKLMDLLWVLEGIIMMLFRNNAVYALAVFTIFYLILGAKKQKIRILVMCLALVIGGKGALEGMQIIIGTEGRGSKIEMFSVPLQQFGRVGHYHRNELDHEYYQLVYRYVPHEYWDIYNPPLADTIKNGVGVYTYPYTWEGHFDEMLSAWIKVGLRYPNTYIDAFLELTAGYWFLDDVTWAEVFGYGVEGRMGALSTYTSSTSEEIPEGIAHESKFPALEKMLEEIVSGNCFYSWPVLSNLFKPALYCWALLLMILAGIYMKNRKKVLVMLLPLVYLATMFLGPVVQVRYVLPIMMIIPLMLAVLVCNKDKMLVICKEQETREIHEDKICDAGQSERADAN